MKKKETRVLKLNRETLRTLNDLGGVYGGQTGSLCSGYTDVTCPSEIRCPSDPCGTVGC